MIQFIKILITDIFKRILLRVSKIRIIESKKVFNEYDELKNYLKPGDIILMSEPGFLTNYLIPGKYNHIAIYVGDDCIVHAHYPVVTRDLCEYILEKKDTILVRRHNSLRFLDHKNKNTILSKIVSTAENKIGVSYDMNFYKEKNVEPLFYCSELVKYIFDDNGIIVNIDKEYILPDDFVSCDNFIDVYNFELEKT